MPAGWDPSRSPPRAPRRRPTPARRPGWWTRGAGEGSEVRGGAGPEDGTVTQRGEQISEED